MTLSLIHGALSHSKLSAVQKLVLIGFCNETNHLGQSCPDIATLQNIAGVSRQTVLRTVKGLCSKKLLEMTGEYCPRTSRAIYQVRLKG